ncbi:cytochrome P450 94C1-like [Olea europaea var. sylvestris]|uniref:cytochrome P450 94C1-like n=1 Tax=Olea europaea var. sylvestris TaxID=158386 RepID=UPI000C1CE0F5|nr:cytochrome P450 94C1-like [Olea europaea var. sylvestris]
MIFEAFTWLRLFLFFVTIASFCIVSLSVFVLRLKPWCSCEICQCFVSSRWSLEFSNLCDWYSHLLKKSKTGTIRVHILGNIITANPENVEYMLKKRFDNYPKGKQFSSILSDLLGRGIFNVDGHLWKFQRKMASLELSNLSVKSYAFEIVVSEIRSRLIPLFSSFSGKENGVLDLQDVFRRFSFDSICKFSFGLDPGCLKLSLPDSEFAVAFDLTSKLSAERALTVSPLIWKMKRFFNLGSEKKLRETIKLVNVLAEELIKHKRNMDVSSHEDLVSRFMANIDDDKFLRDIVISFVLAGRDTIASALTTFFWLLSNHPHVMLAIREESDRIMGSKTQDVASFEQLKEMHYLQAAVHESMRLFPPVQFDSKFCQEDDILPDGTFVAKGTRVTYHPYAMGRMETIWGPDCLEFKPERWIQDGIFKQVNPFKYPVFQAGFRVCLGKEMALVEMKNVALSFIRQFDIQMANPSHTLKFTPGLTATVKNGLPVFVQGINGRTQTIKNLAKNHQ